MSRSRNSNVLKRIGSALMSSDKFRDNVEALKRTDKYTGDMTAGSKKRLTKAVSLLVTSTPRRYQMNRVTNKVMSFQLSFVTLTIPKSDKSTDAKVCHKELLEPMLRILRRQYGMKSYVWKCELQENGSVHYHLTSDVFIIHTELRDKWNELLIRNGYMEEFIKEYGHSSPNSTDVHSTRDIRNMEAYLIKYVAKSMKDGKILNAKVWDCSMNLKVGKFYSQEIDSKMSDAIKACYEDGESTVIELERCTIVKFPSAEYIQHYFSHAMNDFFTHLNKIREWTREKKTEIRKQLQEFKPNMTTLEIKPRQLQLIF